MWTKNIPTVVHFLSRYKYTTLACWSLGLTHLTLLTSQCICDFQPIVWSTMATGSSETHGTNTMLPLVFGRPGGPAREKEENFWPSPSPMTQQQQGHWLPKVTYGSVWLYIRAYRRQKKRDEGLGSILNLNKTQKEKLEVRKTHSALSPICCEIGTYLMFR